MSKVFLLFIKTKGGLFMKTFGRMILVAALMSLAAYAFGQSSGAPPYALLRMESTSPVLMSGGLPDLGTLVKLGLDDNQAREVVSLWGNAESAANAKDQIHQIVGDAEFSRISSFLESPQEVAAAHWMGESRSALESQPQSVKNS
jgi:hypothetical protein